MKYKISQSHKLRLPENFEHTLELCLTSLDTTLRKKIKLAEGVKELSKKYNTTTGDKIDIWDRKDLAASYLAYYLPLNFIRMSVIASEAQALGFLDDIKTIVDVGSGPGTAEFAFNELGLLKNMNFLNFELNQNAVTQHEQVFHNHRIRKPKHIHTLNEAPKDALGVFSYVLNEMPNFENFERFNSLMILEPSTHKDARNLMKLRTTLIEQGFHIWGPCLHQAGCPLLLHSKKDWCHFRVFWERPLWMQQLEQPLGFNNRSLTYSYMLAKRTPPKSEGANGHLARVIGDTLAEKGKTKQAICRGEDREFVSWLHRSKEVENIPRGSVIELPATSEQKGNEVRIMENSKILWQP